jgi:RNA polymerase sigma-70 factor (ECF subfamily)
MTDDGQHDDSHRFSSVERRLQAGDEAAAREVFERYSKRLIHLARSRMGGRLQSKIDPEDVVQSAFRSFFQRQRDGQFSLPTWDSMWGLLIRITLRKCGRNLEHFTAAKRDVRQDAAAPGDADASWSSWAAIDRAPTADEAAQLRETIGLLMAGMDDPGERTTFAMRLEGCKVQEIADRLGCTERTVQRKLDRIKRTLAQCMQ